MLKQATQLLYAIEFSLFLQPLRHINHSIMFIGIQFSFPRCKKFIFSQINGKWINMGHVS